MNRTQGKPLQAALPGGTQGIADALANCEPLVLLTRRMQESRARLQTIEPLLPPLMQAHVKAGPIDETGWTLLVANNAVSAKLRQMLPAIETRLRDAGWPATALRVKLLNPS